MKYRNLNAARLAATIYGQIEGNEAKFQLYRPAISPFDEILATIPINASVLDVGCGAGLLLNLLSIRGHRGPLVGFDSNERSIETATKASQSQIESDPRIVFPEFHHIDVNDPWPIGEYDCVCLVDVMHHVQKPHRITLLETIHNTISGGGILVYKDMGRKPYWRAMANQLHDLLRAGEWIEHEPVENVHSWFMERGYKNLSELDITKLVYAHELRVYQKP